VRELFINTAALTTHFLVLDNGNIAHEDHWTSHNNEANSLLPALNDYLHSHKEFFTNLSKIKVVKGPGSFTGVRIGVTIANILAYMLPVELYETDYFSYLEHACPSPGTVILKAGKNQIYKKAKGDSLDQIELHHLLPTVLDNLDGKIWGDLSTEQEEKALLWISERKKLQWVPKEKFLPAHQIVNDLPWKKVGFIAPLYIKPPNITKSKN